VAELTAKARRREDRREDSELRQGRQEAKSAKKYKSEIPENQNERLYLNFPIFFILALLASWRSWREITRQVRDDLNSPITSSRLPSRLRAFAVALIPIVLAAGCITHPANPAATQPVTRVDPKQATMNYWLSQDAVVSVNDKDFNRLWYACRQEVHDRFFQIDREDFRRGEMSTLPMVSKGFWEVWRSDVVTPYDLSQSSLATLRRSVWFEIRQQPDGTYAAQPKVLVERYASDERRLTLIAEYQTAFSSPRVVGNSATDEGLIQPTDYWYSIGRDHDLERNLAEAITRRLRSK
jgi:hypothetical protein